MHPAQPSQPFDPEMLGHTLTDWIAVRVSTAAEPPLSEVFLARGRQAAARARSLRQLSAAAESQEFRALALPDFLAAAARTAKVNLTRLLPAAREGEPAPLPWIRLAKTIGMQRERVVLLTRLWVADRLLHPTVFSPLLARSGDGPGPSRSALASFGGDERVVVQTLTYLEAEYDDVTHETLKVCLAEIGR